MVKVADFILAKWRTSHPPRGETRLHFSFPQRERKIDVATSVCTGSSHMPPAYGDLIFESLHYAKIRNGKSHSGFLVQVARLELAASCSQSRRATNCATPGYTFQIIEAGALPVAVPGIFVSGKAPSSSADRSHLLSSLSPPPAAVASLPNCAIPGLGCILRDSHP